MIEVMIVIGIAALIMSMGIPSFVKLLNKDPMRQSIADILEACGEARAQAIITGAPFELRFRPGDRSMNIGAAARESESGEPGETGETGRRPAAPQRTGKGYPKQISENVRIEMLDVNLTELKDADEARVRFYPNGTSDEFTIVIAWAQSNEYLQITLDSITGMASMRAIR
jgi:Tfp pilus assembly protein FimT